MNFFFKDFSSLVEGGGKVNNQFKGEIKRKQQSTWRKAMPEWILNTKGPAESHLGMLNAHLSTRISRR